MSLSNRPRMFTRKNRPGETADKSVKIFFHPNSSIEQDGDEKSSDDINADDDDDLDDICLGKTKRTPLLFVTKTDGSEGCFPAMERSWHC